MYSQFMMHGQKNIKLLKKQFEEIRMYLLVCRAVYSFIFNRLYVTFSEIVTDYK